MQDERLIYLVGSEDLRNTLLAQLLQDRLGYRCRAVCRVDALHPPSPAALLLIDASGMAPDDIEPMVQEVDRRQDHPVIALFNADADAVLDLLLIAPSIRGIFLRETEPAQMFQGIGALLQGEHWLPRHMTSTLLDSLRRPAAASSSGSVGTATGNLTRREERVLSLIGEGYSNTAIASSLHLSVHTVKTHVYNVFRKLDVTNRVQAARVARNVGQGS